MPNNFPKMPFFLSLIFLAFSLLAFLFLYREIDKNNKNSEQVLTEWQSEASRREEVKMLDHFVKIIEPEKNLLESHFAKSSDVVPFLNTIEKLANETGTKAEVTSVDIPKDNPGLIVEMQATGNFETIYKFLTLLENSPYELSFSLVDIKREDGQATSGKNIGTPKWVGLFKLQLLSFIP